MYAAISPYHCSCCNIPMESGAAVHLPEGYLHLRGMDKDLRQLLHPRRRLQHGVPFQKL